MISSSAVPATWEDDQECEVNGTLQNKRNFGWISFNARVGIFDLKAPDIDYFASHWRFFLSPQIPPRAKILAASVSGGAQDTRGGTLDTLWEVLDWDGIWDEEPEVTPARWVSGDVSTNPIEIGVDVYDSGPTLLATAGPIIFGAGWPIRRWGGSNPSRGLAHGEVVDIDTTGTLDTVDFTMQRFGTIAGTNNVWAEVWSVDGDGLPDTLLATSDLRDASSIATTQTVETFTFTGGDAIALTSGQTRCFVITGDYTESIINYLVVMTGLGNANKHPVTFGEGRGFCDGNYPAMQQVRDIPTISGSGSVAWAPPNFTINVVYTSPSLVSLLQAAVNAPGYAANKPIGIRWRRLGSSQLQNRGFKTWESPDTPGVVQQVTLNVDWRPRRMDVG